MSRTDESSLESAIISEAENMIRAIAQREAEESKKLRDEYEAEIEEFRNRMETQTNARITQEQSREESRAALDLKKLKLRTAETFISRVVEEAAAGIRGNQGYKSFLLNAVQQAVSLIPTGAEIRVNQEDLVFEQEFREAVKSAGGTDISIVEDNSIKWGGCIVVDGRGGRIFDGTIERLAFRKSSVIRQEVMRILANPPGNTE
jgi:vacuolar-type H+-ATPase subunit E/Vma4